MRDRATAQRGGNWGASPAYITSSLLPLRYECEGLAAPSRRSHTRQTGRPQHWQPHRIVLQATPRSAHPERTPGKSFHSGHWINALLCGFGSRSVVVTSTAGLCNAIGQSGAAPRKSAGGSTAARGGGPRAVWSARGAQVPCDSAAAIRVVCGDEGICSWSPWFGRW